MKFDTFLEDFAWFRKEQSTGSTYLNPVKRDLSWLKPDRVRPVDMMHFEEQLEDDNDADELKEDITNYKKNYSQSPLLINFVKRCKLNRDYIVYRNFSSRIDVSKLKSGSVILSLPNKLTPTSIDYNIALTFSGPKNLHNLEGKRHMWTSRIVVKKGTPGFYADAVETYYGDEKEILLWIPSIKVTGFSYVIKGPLVIHTVDCVI